MVQPVLRWKWLDCKETGTLVEQYYQLYKSTNFVEIMLFRSEKKIQIISRRSAFLVTTVRAFQKWEKNPNNKQKVSFPNDYRSNTINRVLFLTDPGRLFSRARP